MQPLIWSNNSLNRSAINLNQVIIISTTTNRNSTETYYRIVFHFIGKESTYWNYDDPCLRNQDYTQLLATHCKDISQ